MSDPEKRRTDRFCQLHWGKNINIFRNKDFRVISQACQHRQYTKITDRRTTKLWNKVRKKESVQVKIFVRIIHGNNRKNESSKYLDVGLAKSACLHDLHILLYKKSLNIITYIKSTYWSVENDR